MPGFKQILELDKVFQPHGSSSVHERDLVTFSFTFEFAVDRPGYGPRLVLLVQIVTSQNDVHLSLSLLPLFDVNYHL